MTVASTTDGVASRAWLRPGPFALTLPALLLLTLLFMLPLLRLFSLSFSGGFGWYEKALTGGLYTVILYRTFEIAGIVTFFSLLIGYPVAFLLATTTPKWRAVGHASSLRGRRGSSGSCSSNSSASFSVMAPPSSSASTMVTARR